MFNIKAALNGTLRRMHYVQRYSSVPVLKPENVAEHSWQVAMLSYFMGLDLRDRRGRELDMERLLREALLHDVSEALSGDIIRSFKHSSEDVRQAIAIADDANMNQFAKEIGGYTGQKMYTDWSRAKSGDLIGDIVSLADMLCVVSYCTSEHQLGNRQADFILKRLYEDTLCKYHEHPILFPYLHPVFPNRQWNDPLHEEEII